MFSMRLHTAPPAVLPARLMSPSLAFPGALAPLSSPLVAWLLTPSSDPPRLGTPFLLDFYFRRIADRAKLFCPMLVCEAFIIEY